MLNEEGRVVVGALLAHDPEVPLKHVLPDLGPPPLERGFLQP